MEYILDYEPNLNDPRNKRRILHVMGWAWLRLSTTRYRKVDKVELDAVFGPSGNKFGRWLRNQLLIEQPWYNKADFGEVKSYILRDVSHETWSPGQDVFQIACSAAPSCSKEYLLSVHPEILSLEFVYRDEGRLYHPLQNVRREVKPVLWNTSLPFDYDIQACMPTILSQLAKRAGMKHCHALDEFLANRKKFRELVRPYVIAQSEQNAKELITALFNGAPLGVNPDFVTFRLLRGKKENLDAVRELLNPLLSNISSMWSWLRIYEKADLKSNRLFDGLGEVPNLGLKSGKQKYSLYVKHERQVLNTVIDHLKATNNRHFLEHDGWRTERPIDVEFVQELIRQKTGFNLRIE